MAQLKDETLRLRDRNRELARRAIEDSERIQALAAAGGQTQQAAMSFQREREELARAYAELQQQVQAAADIPVRAGRDADQRRR